MVSNASELLSALSNANNNNKTVKLSENITISKQLVFSTNMTITLNLNGKTLTVNAGNTQTKAFLQTAGDLTIKNGTVSFTNAQRGFCFGDAPDGDEITNTSIKTTFSGLTINNNTSGYTISGWQWPNATIYVNDCTINSSSGRGLNINSGICYVNSTTITTGGTYYGIGAGSSVKIGGTVYIDKDKVNSKTTQVTCSASNGTPLYTNETGIMYVYGGTFSNASYTAINVNNNNLYIYGGSFNGKISGNGKITITGGKFNCPQNVNNATILNNGGIFTGAYKPQ